MNQEDLTITEQVLHEETQHSILHEKIWRVFGFFPPCGACRQHMQPQLKQEDFAYTVGLLEMFDHPELIVFSMPHNWATLWINLLVVERIKAEKPIAPFEVVELQEGAKVQFLPVDAPGDYFGLWFNHYEVYYPERKPKSGFRAMQMVWTDKQGRYPWEEGFNLNCGQPIIGRRTPQ